MPRSTVARLVGTLVEQGYLDRVPGRRYALGAASLALGTAAASRFQLAKLMEQALAVLAEEFNASVAMGVRDGFDMLYVATAASLGTQAFRRPVGLRIQMMQTAMGRAYLLALGSEERQLLVQDWLSRSPDRAAWVRMRLAQATLDHERCGACFSFGDWQRSVNAAGVSLTLPQPFGLCALTCGGVEHKIPAKVLRHRVVPRLHETARRLVQFMQGEV